MIRVPLTAAQVVLVHRVIDRINVLLDRRGTRRNFLEIAEARAAERRRKRK